MPIIEQKIQQNASKADPTSNQQKRQHVAIVARVPDIISSVLFFQFVCLCPNTCPPTFSTMRTTCLPTDFQVCIENTKKSAQFSSFLQDAIAIHLLSNTILPGVLFFLLLNLTYATFHFEPLCHRKKIPSKSFVLYFLTLLSTPTLSSSPLSQNKKQVHTFTFLHLTVFFIQREEKIHFRIQIDLQLNFIQIIRSSFFLSFSYTQLLQRRRPSCFSQQPFQNICHSCHSPPVRCGSVSEVVLCFSLFHFLSFPSFLSTSTIFRFLSSNSLTLHPVFVHKSPLESVFVSFFSAINFFLSSQ